MWVLYLISVIGAGLQVRFHCINNSITMRTVTRGMNDKPELVAEEKEKKVLTVARIQICQGHHEPGSNMGEESFPCRLLYSADIL